MQPRVEAFRREELLAADEAGEEFKPGAVTDVQLVPHVEDVVNHSMVTEAFIHEHPFDLLDQVRCVSVKQNLLLEVGLKRGDNLRSQVIVGS